MSPASKSFDPKDLIFGGVLQSVEAMTFGMPFEVWKTHMGTYRSEGTMQAFKNIYNKGGVLSFWSGWQPKLFESFMKGGILLFSKEAIIDVCKKAGLHDITSGLIGGFGGGVAQVSVLGPCTFLVTASVTGDRSVSTMQRIKDTYASRGLSGFYRGGTALMLRQGSNWASRQGFTDVSRELLKSRHVGSNGITNTKQVKLGVAEEAFAGILGGALSTWNQPFEVMRIEAQAAAARGLPSINIFQTCRHIVKESGVRGLFQGILPRMGLCIWQTLFMVTVPYILKPN